MYGKKYYEDEEEEKMDVEVERKLNDKLLKGEDQEDEVDEEKYSRTLAESH